MLSSSLIENGRSRTSAFAHLFNDVFTTIDIAPVKRPQLSGSLVCSVDNYPFTVMFVEDCTGISSDAVTQLVQQHAVRLAEQIRTCTRKSVRVFLLDHVCESWPGVMGHLSSLDLALQLRLVLAGAVAVDAVGATPHDRKDFKSPEIVSAASDTVGGASAIATASAQWKCSASLYDPWQTQPRFTPLRNSTDSKGDAGAEDTLVLTGELLAVVKRVMARVEVLLTARCAAQVEESAGEAARYTHEAGQELSQLWLTSQLQSAAMKAQAASSPPRWWFEAVSSLSCPTWVLSCKCWADVSRNEAVGVQLRLEHVVVDARSASAGHSPTVLAHALVNRVQVPLILRSAAPNDTDCLYADEAFSDAAQLRQQRHVQTLTSTDLVTRLTNGTISLSAAWADTPLRTCGVFVEQAALLSPTVAYDWLGAERCSEVVAEVGLNNYTATAAMKAEAPQLPGAVRWTSFEGRRVMDAFVAAAAAAPCDAVEGCRLPPLWPRVQPQSSATETSRRAAFRELIRSELGLRQLPRTELNALPAGTTDGVFVCEDDVVVGWEAPKEAEAARLRIGTEWYVNVAAAAQAHTPWALPLCTPTSSTAATAATAKVRRDETLLPIRKLVWVLSITDSLLRSGVSHATWDATADELLCFTHAPREPPLRFSTLSTTDGLASLFRFCAKSAVHSRTFYLTTQPAERVVPRLLGHMMTCRAEAETTDTRSGRSRSVAPQLSSARDDDDGRVIAVLPLPFHAGTTRLLASSKLTRATELRRLITYIQHFSRSSSAFTSLLAAAPPVNWNFFHGWAVTEPWLQPRGPLRAELLADATADEELRRRRALDGRERSPAGRSTSACRDDAESRSFTLCVDAAPSAEGSNEEKTSDVAAVALHGDEKLPSLPAQTRVRLPVSGGAWISAAYAAIRAAALSLPPTAAPSPTEDGDKLLRLLQCATFAQLAEVALCTLLNDGMGRRRMSYAHLLFALFGNHAVFVKEGGEVKLHLQVTPEASVCLSRSSEESPVAKTRHQSMQWRVLLIVAFFADAAPELLKSLEAAKSLNSVFSDLSSQSQSHIGSIAIRIRWLVKSAITRTARDADGASRLLFIAEVWRAAQPSASAASSPAEAMNEGKLVYTASDFSLAAVLQSVLNDFLRPLQMVYRPAGSDEVARCVTKRHCTYYSLDFMQREIAWQRQLQEVTTQYDVVAGSLRILGRKQRCKDGKVADDDSPVVLAEETVSTWGRVPQVIYRLHRQLLPNAEQHRPEVTVDKLCSLSWKHVRDCLCEVLGCTEEHLTGTSVLHNRMWYCEMILPSHLFSLAQVSTVSPPPSHFYLSSCNTGKQSGQSLLLACLFHWIQFSQTAEVDYEKLYGVQCSTTRVVCPQAMKKAHEDRSFLREMRPDNDGGGPHSRGVVAPKLLSPATSSTPSPATPFEKAGPLARRPRASTVLGGAGLMKISLVDRTHSKVKALLSEVLDDSRGHVALKLSQTFGLELMYDVVAVKDDPDEKHDWISAGSVQLLRESWAPGTWAPAQILRAEAVVLARLLCRDPDMPEKDRAELLHVAMRELMHQQPLLSLSCGADISRKDFCVSFLRRYFGWRVCEQADVADLPISATQSNIVVYTSIANAASSSAPRRGRSHRKHAPLLTQTRASLHLGQIVSQGDARVRLAQVLVEAADADVDAAGELLWDACARRVKEVFGVSRLMTTSEVDTGMLRFMERGGSRRG
ncbi:hypothetical protein ABB37_00822 [Leptomonas pyrrhocoris]|uniref:Uncharacterized protein n=1 Tax=Leptomonas pyrrhocoris TaxID=157538 RepID=A0A0N0E0R4_LEPPY|nr:hypothetical protein ABB37_00822 [Leptomonas pyrrhocoris]KPA86742.1 hypothetical protein ABB37_00822 [Leptomonas pyrrhocoris]|eukprot:XP_015665181.1 hypothetical protein ABB37_00822 [Leptomonas pyrrhocoris]